MFDDDTISEEGEELPSDPISLEAVSISELPVKIQLEISRFEVSLEELGKMEPGYKLPIDINPRIVHLISSGKRIGKGEIIEVGGTIGVKILELYK